ncbi:methyltransferase domain-containing protein [Xanthobacter sp. DSM 24535]|uniref:methyltransferase domain-containing protein n=1 Tax=Roseixanthobacter psychrophilus TaxID=3119917 RepID=UPI003726B507
MRLAHFEALRPVCPACLRRGIESPLQLAPGAQEDAAGIGSGVLRCPEVDCRIGYPIIEGAPILVPDLSAWLAANGHLLLQRHELPDQVEGLIADALGPDAAFNVIRTQQASYAHDHYGDLEEAGGPHFGPLSPAVVPGAVRRCLAAALAQLPQARGPVLDIGCAVGRTSFDLAAATSGLVLGIDVNWPLLAVGRGILDRGLVSYPHRRVGLTFERRRHAVAFAGAERVDFWIADALALPFRARTFDLAVAMNVLDCVSSPSHLLWEMARILDGGGGAALATPFDWGSHATPPDAWLDGPAALETLLAQVNASARAAGTGELIETGAPRDLDWHVRLHDRAAMHYAVHLVTAILH